MSSIPPPPPPNIPPPPPPPPPGDGPPPPIPPGAPTYGAVSSYATFGARFGALLIDGLLQMLMVVPGLVVLLFGPTELDSCRVDAAGDYDPDGAFLGVCEEPTGGTIALAILLFAVFLIGFGAYQAHRQGTRGHTIGKSAVGIRVIDANTGAYIGFGRSIGRTLFAQFVSGNLCLLGYLWSLWDKQNQTWHDKLVNSVVVKV